MKLFNVYKGTNGFWEMPILIYGKGRVFVFFRSENKNGVIIRYEIEDDDYSFDDSKIDNSIIPQEEKHLLIDIIFESSALRQRLEI